VETIYLPYAQHADARVAAQVIFTVKTEVPPASVARSLSQAVWKIDANLPVFDVAPVEQQYASTIAEQRLGAVAFSVFSILGTLLAALGIYGLMSHLVNQRHQELGIRMALGADRLRILGLVATHAALLIAVGIVLGCGGGMALASYLESLMPEVAPLDLTQLAGLALLLALTTLGACQIPAFRATRIDPQTALRME
ncbi:MAG: FtsX-like permease family protein, partial [Acidobacteriota bacterium]